MSHTIELYAIENISDSPSDLLGVAIDSADYFEFIEILGGRYEQDDISDSIIRIYDIGRHPCRGQSDGCTTENGTERG